MAEIRWIKITTDVFSDEKIRLIEQMPDGDTLIVIWFKLLCMAGKSNNNGIFVMANDIPYTEEMLATIFCRPLNTVRLAISTFEAFGMIDIIDDIITLVNWDKHQNIEGMEKIREQNRIRQQRHRAGLKLEKVDKICVYCGSTENISVDHIIPKSRGGSDEDENKVWSCLKCNMQKSNLDVSDFLNNKVIMNEHIDINSIMSNSKLKKVVRYEEGKFLMLSQMSRDGHAIEEDKDKEKKIKEEKNNINELFEEVWKLYPRKKGKGQVSATQKKKLYEIGLEHLTRCIERYKADTKDTDPQYIMHGSTFFNSGYIDYLDDNYSPEEHKKKQSKNRFHNLEEHDTDYEDLVMQQLGVML